MRKVLIFFSGLLSACVPPLTREEQLAIYQSRCLDYGFLWGTPEFANCMMNQDVLEANLAIQERKVQALETQNYIQEQKVLLREGEMVTERKKRKKGR